MIIGNQNILITQTLRIRVAYALYVRNILHLYFNKIGNNQNV